MFEKLPQYTKEIIEKEIVAFSKYFEVGKGVNLLEDSESRRLVILKDDDINEDDAKKILKDYQISLNRYSRVLVISETGKSKINISKIATESGFELLRVRRAVYCPANLLGIGKFINWLFPSLPLLRELASYKLFLFRPIKPSVCRPSLTIIIPARNEKGNIENAIKRMPDFKANTEVIFVEGNSTDGTFEECQRVAAAASERLKVKVLKQPGRGKADAVRHGIENSTNEVITILDADLTMPPEKLPEFFDSFCNGKADFVNGNRLLYPMESQAMRPLNFLGNHFFAKALAFVLDVKIGDTLCGTKLFTRKDYQRFCAWRSDFGDFDPFGDFELLFPAAVLGVGMIDQPIKYLDRTYGSTNIYRFRHGLMLLRMTLIGFLKLKTGKV